MENSLLLSHATGRQGGGILVLVLSLQSRLTCQEKDILFLTDDQE